jgi:hypothetical protein
MSNFRLFEVLRLTYPAFDSPFSVKIHFILLQEAKIFVKTEFIVFFSELNDRVLSIL